MREETGERNMEGLRGSKEGRLDDCEYMVMLKAQEDKQNMLTLQHRNYPTSGTAGTKPDTEFGVL